MALEDIFSNLHLLVRWIHVIAGITWIGLLYFFNFVNIPLQGALDDAAKKAVNPQLMPRALWWFRWGAMFTFLAGLGLFVMNYMYTPGQGFGPTALFTEPEGGMTGRAAWILMGMFFGTLMWFNVWFIIWPAQKKILSGQAGDALAALRKKAGGASKMNTVLSGPMLFGMLGAPHYGAANPLSLIVAIILGIAVIKGAYAISTKVGKSV
ncbi:MAG: urate hydroxylase PuuD [Candidatus Omnitrophota bacterium]|nr:urate hydroxylase PuuD [Candidatus Omnitrophota bacterium]